MKKDKLVHEFSGNIYIDMGLNETNISDQFWRLDKCNLRKEIKLLLIKHDSLPKEAKYIGETVNKNEDFDKKIVSFFEKFKKSNMSTIYKEPFSLNIYDGRKILLIPCS